MATINSILTTFAQQNLVLGYQSNEREKIESSLSHLEKLIKDTLSGQIKEIIRFGSYTRNTILPRKYDPQSDIDLMIVFQHDGNTSPETYRNKIKRIIENSYPNSLSKKDFPVIKLELNHIMFDLVPAYVDVLFWGKKKYYIPRRQSNWSKWQETLPNDINEQLSKKNQDYGNNIVRNVIRLCKHWNAINGRIFDSYEMEKWIVGRYFYIGDNLYDKFLSVMNDLAGDLAGVRQALDYIQKYKGD
jgi:predicted nucleotidyltransferase